MAKHTAAQLFGELVRKRRLSAGISQEALAAAAECHPTYISLLENGRRNPSLDTMIRLARALDCPAWKLVRETESRLGRDAVSA
ncbi:MAG TPA: helix-turn-helix transcriptional regulator [Woeseiaceae bacterium]|nr:helix-turn-helix transcriptional regulator [Woeseiaceae bacterium]